MGENTGSQSQPQEADGGKKKKKKISAVNSLAVSAGAPVGRTAVSSRQISPNATSDTVCSVQTVPPLPTAGPALLPPVSVGRKTQEELLSRVKALRFSSEGNKLFR